MKKVFTNILSCFLIVLSIIILIGGDVNTNLYYGSYSEPDSVYARYFPLNVGNKFVYLNSNYFPGQTWLSRASIVKDSIFDGKKYFYCQNFPYISSVWVRFDTATGNLLKRSSSYGCSIYPDDIILDSMRSKINDQVNCVGSKRCADTNSINMFNQYQRKSINFINDGMIYQVTRYVLDFGIREGCSGEPPPCESFYNLKGCVINGVVYGDTTMTYVKTISSNVPDKYMLFQNYPNPFNPSTNIRFRIKESGFAILKVFNILGKEVATLVNEELKPGEHEITFKDDILPSGSYFYSLSTKSFNDTKKMLKIK